MRIATPKKLGRPTDSPKDTMFRVRLDKESMDKLNSSAEQLATTKSEVIRQGINNVYDSLKK